MNNQPGVNPTLPVTIYKIVCRVNQKVYVGSTIRGMAQRLRAHEIDLRIGRHCNRGLQSDFDCFGILEFECTEVAHCTLEDRMSVEFFWINRLGGDNPDYGYNIVRGSKKKLTARALVASQYRCVPKAIDWNAPGVNKALDYIMDIDRIEAREIFFSESKNRHGRRVLR